MSNRLVWLTRAEHDLTALHEFIGTENRRAADNYVEAILDACGRLASFPQSGRAYRPIYRILVVRNHLVFYRFEDKAAEVVIVAVVDGRRDISALLFEEFE